MTPDKIHARLCELGEQWADLDGKASLLEETQKTLLAQIALEHKGESAAKAEMIARSDERYRTHIEAMVYARTEANKAREA